MREKIEGGVCQRRGNRTSLLRARFKRREGKELLAEVAKSKEVPRFAMKELIRLLPGRRTLELLLHLENPLMSKGRERREGEKAKSIITHSLTGEGEVLNSHSFRNRVYEILMFRQR